MNSSEGCVIIYMADCPAGERRRPAAAVAAVYEEMRKHIYVGYLFVGDRRHDATAVSLADGDDGAV